MAREFVFTHKEDDEIDDIHVHAYNREAASYKLERMVKHAHEWEYSHEVTSKSKEQPEEA